MADMPAWLQPLKATKPKRSRTQTLDLLNDLIGGVSPEAVDELVSLAFSKPIREKKVRPPREVGLRLIHDDMLAALDTFPENSIDSCVTDAPYHLASIVKRFGSPTAAPVRVGKTGAYARASKGFMGQEWDGGDIAFRPETWAKVLRVLKPGAHILAFGGTKGFHRMACAIEDGGFELRDTVCWLYGSGFPKSHDVAQDFEQRLCVRREYEPGKSDWFYVSDGERMVRTAPFRSQEANDWEGWGTALKPAWEPIIMARKPLEGTVAANVLEHRAGALNVDACRVEVNDAAYARNASGDRGHDDNRKRGMDFGMTAGSAHEMGRWPANVVHDGSEEVQAGFPDTRARGNLGQSRGGGGMYGHGPALNDFGAGDSGNAARFFYCAKANKEDRGEGNDHPTVKPTDLMRYLCRLITPYNGLILDPFMGSGSTGKAAALEGFDFVGIEREAHYMEIARNRLNGLGEII